MPKKKSFNDLSTKTVSADILTVSCDAIELLKSKFEFDEDFSIEALLNDVNSWYKLISQMPKEPTERQTAKRLSELHDQITTLRDTIDKLSHKERTLLIRASGDAEVKFLPSESINYLNYLARHTFMATPQEYSNASKGRPKRREVNIVLDQLYNAYEIGTGKAPTYSYNNYEESYTSNFVEFCEDIITLLKLDIANISIGEYMKIKRADLKNKRKNSLKKND